MKRTLTDDERATRLASEFQSSDATSAGDWAASIRAASMRVRKSVTEGYLSSPPSSPLKQAPVSLTGATASGYHWQLSARESHRQVFPSSSGSYSPLPSPSKRKHTFHDNDERSITSFFVTSEPPVRGDLAAELSSNDMIVDRPMKPLRRSGRIREMPSLPQSCSLFRCETEMNSHQFDQDSTNMRSAQLFSPDLASDNEQH